MDLTDGGGVHRRGDRPTDAPTRHRVGLRQRVDGDRAVFQTRNGGGRNVATRATELDVFVDLVGDDERVVALAQLGDQLQLDTGENLAGRIVRCVDDDSADTIGEGCAQLGLVNAPVRPAQRDEPGPGTGEDRVRAVVLVEGLEHDHLLTGINERQHHRDHRLGGTAGHTDLGLRVDRPARVGAGDLAGDRMPERRRPPGDGVLVVVGVDGGLGRLLEFGRAGKVREALREVDTTVRQTQPGHLPDHRLGERPGLRRYPTGDGAGRTSRSARFARFTRDARFARFTRDAPADRAAVGRRDR